MRGGVNSGDIAQRNRRITWRMRGERSLMIAATSWGNRAAGRTSRTRRGMPVCSSICSGVGRAGVSSRHGARLLAL